MIQICMKDKAKVYDAIRTGKIDAAEMSFPNLIDDIVLTMKKHGLTVKLAVASKKWQKHPNWKRKTQEIQLVTDPGPLWESDKPEEDFRQTKDFWKPENFKSTKYNYITCYIVMTLTAYMK